MLINEKRDPGRLFCIHLDLEEDTASPEALLSEQLLSKGFFPGITVQDFPIRGHKVFMPVKRRRWLRVKTGEVVFRDWTSVAPGTLINSGFAAFLKEISRYGDH